MHPKKMVCEVVSSKQITVISKEPVWVSPKPPDYVVTLFYKMEMERAWGPLLQWTSMPPQPLISPDSWGLSCSVTASSNFLLPPNSLSQGCLLPLTRCALFPSGLWCLTSPGNRAQYRMPLQWSRAVSDSWYKASSRRLLCQIHKGMTWQRRLRLKAGTDLHPHLRPRFTL